VKTALVTGGLGFIGSHLVATITLRGYKVIVLDDLSTGRMENVHGLPVEIVIGSVCDWARLEPLVRQADYVFHMAAISSVTTSLEDPAKTAFVNTVGAGYIARAWLQTRRAQKLVLASSSAVYGNLPELPKSEKMMLSPESPYATSKLHAEGIWRMYCSSYGADMVSLRYFNVYGPRQRPETGAVIPSMFHSVLRGKSPVIYGGEQTRDFVFVQDAVDATVMLAEGDANGVFNVGSGESVSINQLFHEVASIVRSRVVPDYALSRNGDVQHSQADISCLHKEGFEPKYNLRDGLQATMEYVRGLLW